MFEALAFSPDQLWRMFEGFQAWNPPQFQLSLISLMTGFSAYMVSRLLSAAPMLTLPFSYIVLFAFSMFSNYLGRDVFLSSVTEVQKIVVFTMLAQAFIVPLLFFTFKTGEAGRKAF
jgi:uncharacterized membrane protein YjjP (DUF1212 family)